MGIDSSSASSSNGKHGSSSSPSISAELKEPEVAAQRHSTRSSSNNASGKDTYSADLEGDGKQRNCLNTYAIYPTTVPPFVLDAQIQKLKVKHNATGSKDIISDENNRFNLKDPFLVTYDGKWGKFASNVGSNVAYPHYQRASLPLNSSSTDSSLSGTEKRGEEESFDGLQIERDKVKREILTDLGSDWGGGKRLEELFNTPVMGKYEFKNNEDREEWFDYISKAKQFYYGRGLNQKQDSEGRGAFIGEASSARTYNHPDWLEEWNKDKLRWKKLKQRKLRQWRPALTHLLVDNQYLPLGLRITIGVLCIISLGLAVRIFQNSASDVAAINESVPQQPSTIMALCVNTIAVVYIIYIAQDEFSGKPLGLRNPFGKLRLILLDLLFIIFCSANLALAFNTLYDKQWVCTDDGRSSDNKYPKISYICRKQRALSSFLFVMLFMWVTTFTVSIVRVVEKVSSPSPRD